MEKDRVGERGEHMTIQPPVRRGQSCEPVHTDTCLGSCWKCTKEKSSVHDNGSSALTDQWMQLDA